MLLVLRTRRVTDCVMVRPWKAENYLKIDNWSVFVLSRWRFVVGIIMRWEGREPFSSRCHGHSGINKAASLLLLSFAKVSNTKDLLNTQPCQGILCVSAESPNKWRRRCPGCLLYTSPSPRDRQKSRMPSSA